MSESTKLFPDGSRVRLLVSVEGPGGDEIEAGTVGIVAASSENALTYTVNFEEPAGTSAVVEAGSVVLD